MAGDDKVWECVYCGWKGTAETGECPYCSGTLIEQEPDGNTNQDHDDRGDN